MMAGREEECGNLMSESSWTTASCNEQLQEIVVLVLPLMRQRSDGKREIAG